MMIVIKKTLKQGHTQVPRNQTKPRRNLKNINKSAFDLYDYTPALVIDHRMSSVSKAELNEKRFLFPNVSKTKALKVRFKKG